MMRAQLAKAPRAMVLDPSVRTFLVNADRVLRAAELISNEAPPPSTASEGRGRRFKSSHSDQQTQWCGRHIAEIPDPNIGTNIGAIRGSIELDT